MLEVLRGFLTKKLTFGTYFEDRVHVTSITTNSQEVDSARLCAGRTHVSKASEGLLPGKMTLTG